MLLLIDNYDSFSYNLVQMFGGIDPDIRVIRNDACTVDEIRGLAPSHIVLSPGPGYPVKAGVCEAVVRSLAGKIPILGVCLGHQAIGHFFGARVEKGERPMHGKLANIRHGGRGLFAGLAQDFSATRYHSLMVSGTGFPPELSVDAVSVSDGVIMGISHRRHPVYGVQFHPEAVLTECGLGLLDNFGKICREWRRKHENHPDA